MDEPNAWVARRRFPQDGDRGVGGIVVNKHNFPVGVREGCAKAIDQLANIGFFVKCRHDHRELGWSKGGLRWRDVKLIHPIAPLLRAVHFRP